MNRLTTAMGAAALTLAASTAQAAVVWDFSETDGGVVGTFAGSLDLTDAAFIGAATVGFDGVVFAPQPSLFSVPGTDLDIYGASEPGGFGPAGGATTTTQLVSGSDFGLGSGDGNRIAVPRGYGGDTPLAGSITFAGATFDSLGVTPGSYVFELPNDSVTVRFGPVAPVPLPAGLPLLLAGLAALGLVRRRG